MGLTRTIGRRAWNTVILNPAYAAYVRALSPTFWLRMTETSGTIAVNSVYGRQVGAQLLTDPGLEDWLSATNLNSWTEGIAGTSTVNQETSDVYGGSNAARLDIDASNSLAQIAQAVTIVAGDTYRIGAYAKSEPTGKTIQVDLGSDLGSAVALTDAYALKTRDVIGDATGARNFTIKRSSAANASIYMDDATVRKIGELDALTSGATVGQTGQLGANHAYSFDGVNDALTVTHRDSISGNEAFTIGSLLYLNSYGEGNAGRIIDKNPDFFFGAYSGGARVFVNYDTVDVDETIAAAVSPTGEWFWQWLRFDIATGKADVFINKAKHTSTGTASGTKETTSANITIGNGSAGANTMDGLMDELIYVDRALSDEEINEVVTLSGITT